MKARDVNTMSIELKTRLLKTLKETTGMKHIEESVRQDFLHSIS
jgi:hypothetical protein